MVPLRRVGPFKAGCSFNVLPVVVDLPQFGELSGFAGPLDDVAAAVCRHQVALVGGQGADGAGVLPGPLRQVQRPGRLRVLRVEHQQRAVRRAWPADGSDGVTHIDRRRSDGTSWEVEGERGGGRGGGRSSLVTHPRGAVMDNGCSGCRKSAADTGRVQRPPPPPPGHSRSPTDAGPAEEGGDAAGEAAGAALLAAGEAEEQAGALLIVEVDSAGGSHHQVGARLQLAPADLPAAAAAAECQTR